MRVFALKEKKKDRSRARIDIRNFAMGSIARAEPFARADLDFKGYNSGASLAARCVTHARESRARRAVHGNARCERCAFQ